MSETKRIEVAIVGGGPAGQAAALVLMELGVNVVVVDEQPRPGGQILRQPPKDFRVANWMSDRSYAVLRAQLERFETLIGSNWWGGHSVLGITPQAGGFELTVADGGSVTRVTARRVLIAAGCQDLPVPVPGWTLPGVIAAGGLQAFVKSQQLVPGDRITLAGSHPLQLLIAAQIVAAGGTVAAVAFAQPLRRLLRVVAAHPLSTVLHASTLWPVIGALRALHRASVPVLFDAPLRAIEGGACVKLVHLGGGRSLACDTVALCYGFVPQSDLIRQVGAAVRRPGGAGGWAAQVDTWQATSVPGLYAAGETTGVMGAQRAIATGTLAGLGLALDLKLVSPVEADGRARQFRAHARALAHFNALLEAVADPRPYWPALNPDTLVCRCEDVTAGEIETALDTPTRSANAIKLLTRCGMGLCQGRSCEPTLIRLLEARGETSDPGFTARFPARPVSVNALLD
jgi:thioredoxin reductase